MQQVTSQTLYTYWNEVRRGRLAPRRFDIEPMRVADILPDTFILERAPGPLFRFRLAGTRVCEQFGLELRGVNFLDLWRSSDKGQAARMLTKVSDHAAVAVVQFEALSENGSAAAFELVLLPLVHTRDTIDRYLGAISLAGAAPQWLGYEKVASLKLLGVEFVWPERAKEPAPAPESQVPLRPNTTRGRIVRMDRRQFRVFEGGRLKGGN